MELIRSATRLEAWLQAVDLLLKNRSKSNPNGSVLNLILYIESPGSDGPKGLAAIDRVDQFLLNEAEYTTHTVAETIFPGWAYQAHGLDGVFNKYPEEYERLKGLKEITWGTYAHRLVRRADGAGEEVNPLERMITKMKSELGKGRGTMKSCYELGVAEGEYDLPLYGTVRDQNRRRGGPCLSHLSFKLFDGSLHLTAMYRSHDYRRKVIGNLLGLARLQACVAREIGQPMGTMVVHSTYATLEGSEGSIEQLIEDLRPLAVQREEAPDVVAQ